MCVEPLECILVEEPVQKSKKVLVWGQDDLLSWSVNFFLAERKDWDVVNIPNKMGMDYLIRQVEALQPDVVVMYLRKQSNSTRVTMQLFYACPELTVILVNPQENTMEVYNKHQVPVMQVEDLISVVEEAVHHHAAHV